MWKKGFTLVELLVVIAIVGLLASVVLVGLGPVRAKGRDSRRLADIKQIQLALDLYIQKCLIRYPGDANCNTVASQDFNGMKAAVIGANLGAKAISSDPVNASPYVYQYAVSADGKGYVLAATLEDIDNPVLDKDVDSAVLGIDCGTGGAGVDTVYCVQM